MGLDYLELSPVGDGHGVDQADFDRIAGVQVGYETGAEIEEGCGGFSFRDRSGAEKPWRVLLPEELRLPWAVMGPRERAPLVREAWICFRDLILM